jgi:hypothetical protein
MLKKLQFKVHRFILNEKFYPFNIWVSFLLGFFKIFLLSLFFNTFFLNYITNSDFIMGVMYSFVFTLLTMLYQIISIFNPFEFLRILYDTIEKITDKILLRIVRIFRR